MRVVVVGGGVIGVTTAHLLNLQGHEVVLIERAKAVGTGASFANGGLLTPSMAEPWNTPGCWRTLLASLGNPSSPLKLRLRSLPGLIGWGNTFLRNSETTTFERNARSNLRFALYSREQMAVLRRQTGIEYGHAARGSLRMFRDGAAFEHARQLAEQRRISERLAFRTLTTDQLLELEPVLTPLRQRIAGALLYEADEIGDAHLFCTSLSRRAAASGVQFKFGVEVHSFEIRAGRATALITSDERIAADRFIVAAGSYSTPILRRVGIRLPVRPVKGYSLTVPNSSNEVSLRTPLVDDQMHAVVVPFEGAIRAAGTAEFAGYDTTMAPERIRNLATLLREVLPGAHINPDAGRAWCGLRPMSADGVPIIGTTPVANLFVNTGHGHLGWTLAAGSARLMTDLICGDTPTFNPAPLSLARFGFA